MFRRFAIACIALFSLPALAEDNPTITLQILPLEPFRAGHEQHAIARLTHIIDGSPVLADELAVAHTKKFHLLIIDEGLEDFEHVHPDMRDIPHTDCPKWYSCNPGEYPFSWTPKYNRYYRAWADLTPGDSGRQEYAMAQMPHESSPESPEKSFEANDTVTMAGMRFTLTADGPVTAGASAMLHLAIADAKGKPLCGGDDDCHVLEPVLGAFAHIVGFNEDFRTVLHAHPMGEEPKDENARAEPDLKIHILPPRPGFYRVFVQLKMDGKTLFVPFGVKVGDATSGIKNP